MRKHIVIAFLCGMVIPVALLALTARVCTQYPEEKKPAETDTEQMSDRTEDAQMEDPVAYDAQTTISVQKEDGSVEDMTMEAYLTGVILAEMPTDFEEEALKAQAVVARTYTCKRLDTWKHDQAAVCTDHACCQGYCAEDAFLRSGGTEEGIDKARQAVTQTDGMVVRYDGELIDATYFSCSGGVTEDAVAVWGNDIPYLQSVESPGEEDAPRFEETVVFSPEDFCAMTGCTGEGLPEDWFSEPVYTVGGGVDTIEICGEIFTGVQLRKCLGLRSTAFTISVSDGEIIVDTKGFGHRVGMSQYGAQAMAAAGSDWKEILTHYYQGAEIGSIWKG